MKTAHTTSANIIIKQLQEQYEMDADSVIFIPKGDIAYCYTVNCKDGRRYFLKLFDRNTRSGQISVQKLEFYLPVTSELHERELFRHLAYPIRNRHGNFKTDFKDITFVLFNYVEGESLAEAYPFSDHVIGLVGSTIAKVHSVSPNLQFEASHVETFDLFFVDDLSKAIFTLENSSSEDRYFLQLKDIILPKKDEIVGMVVRLQKLQSKAISDPKEKVLCHGDLWGGNMMMTGTHSEMVLVDWEAAIIAPPERDLFQYIGDGFELFLEHYESAYRCKVNLNIDIIGYYIYCRHLMNLTNWMIRIMNDRQDAEQNESDIDCILNHCMDRWEHIEPSLDAARIKLARVR